METPEFTVFSSGLPTSEIESETRAWVESRDLSYSGTAESGDEYASRVSISVSNQALNT